MSFDEWVARSIPMTDSEKTFAWFAWEASAKAERKACIGDLEIVLLMAINGNYSGQEEAVQECLFALQERSNGY